jgi:flagellar biosynthesis/type III secretory pathway protein FliH
MGRIVKAAEIALHSKSVLANDESTAVSAHASEYVAASRETAFAEVTELLVSARAAAEAERAAAKDVALVLARKMAEKIVGRAVELEPSVMGEIAAQALAASRAQGGRVVLRLHPDDRAALERMRPNWPTKIAAAANVQVVADASVGRHGCVVETPVGRLDARLQTQLDALERALRGVWPQAKGERGV